MTKRLFITLYLLLVTFFGASACSILYYIDQATGKIYVVNNEDHWYDVKPSINIIPAEKNKLARLWLGWNNFAQGGVNEAGLFFDVATTPNQPQLPGYAKPKGNFGDNLLANCKNVEEAVNYLQQQKVALTDGHFLFGDRSGHAVVVEWVNGQRHIVPVTDNKLMVTNFLLTDPTKGNFPCPRYAAMDTEINQIRKQGDNNIDLKKVGNILGKAVQPPTKDNKGREGGTLYSYFIDLTDMQFVLVYKLDNSKKITLDLKNVFAGSKKQILNMN